MGTSRSEQPVGSGTYVVRERECLASIAKDHGFFWETLWQLPENEKLRSERADPTVLRAGDRVHLPELQQKLEGSAVEQTHRFRRRGEPNVFRLTVLGVDGPRAGEPYRILIDHDERTGVLDDCGTLAESMPGNAREVLLFIGEGVYETRYDIELGGLDPLLTNEGIRARLENLGFDCGEEAADSTQELCQAIAAYQEECGLSATGELDDETYDRLEGEHDA